MKTSNTLKGITKSKFFDLIYSLNKKGGPEKKEYTFLNSFINSIPVMLQEGVISTSDLETIKGRSDFLNTDVSVMGHMKTKPFGYAGDFLIIDRIYRRDISNQYFKWDQYIVNVPGAQAVRNRKEYFKNLIGRKLKEQKFVRLLNVDSGPARDLKEVYDKINPKRLHTTCVEIDHRAIAHAKTLCAGYLHQVDFIQQNVFRFQTNEKFDVIWSAGLFDYFDDKSFIHVLRQFHNKLEENGEVIIGNFSRNNPNRVLMEVFTDWFINHRNGNELIELGIQAGAEKSKIKVEQEQLGVNLFLRIKK